jgi:hypothetical protein
LAANGEKSGRKRRTALDGEFKRDRKKRQTPSKTERRVETAGKLTIVRQSA